MNLLESSGRLLEASRGIQEASERLQEASRGFQEANLARRLGGSSILKVSRGLQEANLARRLGGSCILKVAASNPLCFRGGGVDPVQAGGACPPTRERLLEANLTHRREGLEA